MANRKVFKSATRTKNLEFEVSSGEVFHARAKLSAGPVLKFAAMIGKDEDDEAEGGAVNISRMADGMIEFLTAAIVPEDRERFTAQIDDIDGITLDELMEIAGWLAGEYAGRPTGTDSDDGSAETPTGPDSTGGVSPTGTTYSRAEPTPLASTA